MSWARDTCDHGIFNDRSLRGEPPTWNGYASDDYDFFMEASIDDDDDDGFSW